MTAQQVFALAALICWLSLIALHLDEGDPR